MTRITRGCTILTTAGTVLLALACSGSAAPPPRPPAQPDSLQQGIALYQQGKYAEAVGALQAASGSEADAYRGASLAKLKRYAEAEAPAAAALAAQVTHPVAAAGLGEALVGLKKFDGAVARMNAVIEAYAQREDRANAAYAFFWRAQAHYAKGQTARAIEDFQVFLQLRPDAPEAQTVHQLLAGLR